MSSSVSVIIPAYNAAATLPWTLASLAAQTYPGWRAIIVDDGSKDATAEVVTAFSDSRIELIRLPSNRGRPYARHTALEAAQGDYLCMLDADDWAYPERIARQVDVLDRTPEAVVVSAGLAIVNPEHQLVGARCYGERGGAGLSAPYTPPTPPPIAHPSIMMRRSAMGDIRPDMRLLRGQDTDFLMRVLRGRRYFALSDLLYAYAEIQSFDRQNQLTAHRLTRTIQAKYFSSHPLRARLNWTKAIAKGAVCRALFAVGRQDILIKRRSRPPTAEQVSKHEAALREVRRHLRSAP